MNEMQLDIQQNEKESKKEKQLLIQQNQLQSQQLIELEREVARLKAEALLRDSELIALKNLKDPLQEPTNSSKEMQNIQTQ